MLCISRKPAAFRPIAGLRTRFSSLHQYPRAVHPARRWFSQSPKLHSPPRHNTLEEKLAAFTNHYAILGLSNTAIDKDIKSAFYALCKRFHPDMMRNVDSKEYENNPDRPQFLKIKASYHFLLDPTKRKPYDAEYNEIVKVAERVEAKWRAERRAAQGVDPNKTIALNLRLGHPTTLPDGSPIREHCVVQVGDLPPQVTVIDLVRAIAEISPPVGRIIDTRLNRPSNRSVDRAALVEFANDDCAQQFGLVALQRRFYVLGKEVMHCRLIPLNRERALRPLPPQVTRVLVIEGPRDHKMMTASALAEFFDREITNNPRFSEPSFGGVANIQDSCTVKDSTSGPNHVTIEWVFTTWRRGANLARAALRRHYPELFVTYGQDPCE